MSRAGERPRVKGVVKGPQFFQKGGNAYSQRAGADEEIPPAGVLEARRKLVWSNPEEVSPSTLGTSSSSSAELESSGVSSAHLDLVMATESGEVLKRRRAGGPWIPDASSSRPVRGSSKLGLEIAGSLERRCRAVAQFEDLVYARGHWLPKRRCSSFGFRCVRNAA